MTETHLKIIWTLNGVALLWLIYEGTRFIISYGWQ